MTHVRIREGTYRGAILFSLSCLAFSVLFGIGGVIAISGLMQNIQDGEQIAPIAGSLLSVLLSLVGVVCLAGASYSNFDAPFRIELGDRLTYRTLRGVYTHEWCDIDNIQFIHRIVHRNSGARYPGLPAKSNPSRQSPYAVVWFEPSTQLVISFADGKQLFETLGRRHALEEKILRILMDGLRADAPGVRRCAAEALGRFRTDAVNLGLLAKWWSAPHGAASGAELVGRADAKARQLAHRSKVVLRDAQLQLEKATKDTDADVRKAATEALRRIESESF
jgi:hypothetical protein